jgi:hypothetical protein
LAPVRDEHSSLLERQISDKQCQRDFLIPNLPQSVNGWLVKDSRKIPNQAQSYKAFRSEIGTLNTNKPVRFTLAKLGKP